MSESDHPYQIFTKDTVEGSYEEWPEWQKSKTTRAKKVEGPFVCVTQEGEVQCDDGYVAVDSYGYPYPISTKEFKSIYEPVEANEDAGNA